MVQRIGVQSDVEMAFINFASSVDGAVVGGGTGTLTITQLSATGVAGTFSFTAVPLAGATGDKAVTAGAFNVTF
jgi:hypothetical protein